jgi:hypothetical protein
MRGVSVRHRSSAKPNDGINIWVERLRTPAAFDCEHLGALLVEPYARIFTIFADELYSGRS